VGSSESLNEGLVGLSEVLELLRLSSAVDVEEERDEVDLVAKLLSEWVEEKKNSFSLCVFILLLL